MPRIQVLDIRGSKESVGSTPHLRAAILEGLLKPPGSRTLPSETLYDEVGLKMYNDGMKAWAEWYYPVEAERQILERYGRDIAKLFTTSAKGKAVLIELGAGSLDKTSQVLLSAAEITRTTGPMNNIAYYALDLERGELERTIGRLQEVIGDQIAGKISTAGMWGTYDDGIRVIEKNELELEPDIPVHILFLGGTIGNFSKQDGDVAFLKSLPLDHKRGDTLLVGMDRHKSADAIERSYGFAAAKDWIMNGLKVSGRVLTGDEGLFEIGNWERYAKYNEELGRYEAGYKSQKEHALKISEGVDITFLKDEVVLVMFSNKYTDAEMDSVVDSAGLVKNGSWMDEKAQYCLLSLRANNGPV
uniref:L-tryptophan methyltransferase trpM n=1 Tax=Psilocybe serbica TaxID=797126 RepID=TRPM_PSISE|nr:L-tryptophan methyltransferase [Psilocybe serbica]